MMDRHSRFEQLRGGLQKGSEYGLANEFFDLVARRGLRAGAEEWIISLKTSPVSPDDTERRLAA